MPSRLKSDLNEILSDAYDKACIEYHNLYPTSPQPFITCTFRSNDEQEQLFAQGRTTKGKIITQAKGGESPHNYNPSAAFDIAFVSLNNKLNWNLEQFKNFADIIIKIQPLIEWGGGWRFKDSPHYQLKEWKKYIHNERIS